MKMPGFILIFLPERTNVPLPLSTVTTASRVVVCSDISVPFARHISVWFDMAPFARTVLNIPSGGNFINASRSLTIDFIFQSNNSLAADLADFSCFLFNLCFSSMLTIPK